MHPPKKQVHPIASLIQAIYCAMTLHLKTTSNKIQYCKGAFINDSRRVATNQNLRLDYFTHQ